MTGRGKEERFLFFLGERKLIMRKFDEQSPMVRLASLLSFNWNFVYIYTKKREREYILYINTTTGE
jgi:hypothetical protein